MAKKEKKHELLVFVAHRDGQCAECGRELHKKDLIFLERDTGALCLVCADLNHLLYLRSGNVGLTRRAKKYSKLVAIVLKWARARKRYERRGILVEAPALERAMQECLDEKEKQRWQWLQEAEDCFYLKPDFMQTFLQKLSQLLPECPPETAEAMAREACFSYLDRMGKPIAHFDDDTVWKVVQTYVRHQYTNYDELLMDGLGRQDARKRVRSQVDAVLKRWGCSGPAAL